jgi:hypothetical protein
MSNSELKTWRQIENNFPIFLGVGEILVGLVLIALQTIFPNINSPFTKLLSDLGIGLIAAGVVTATLEPISRRRLQSDISEIKKANFEAILKGVMPEEIYEEIQAHIIRQPFLRENVRMIFECEWVDSKREILSRSQTTYYEVKNISKTIEKYDVRVLEEREHGVDYLNIPQITEIVVQRDSKDEIRLGQPELAKIQVDTGQHIEVCYPIMLKPGDKVKIWLRSKSMLSNRVHTVIMLVPTINLELTVSHSDDIVVRAFPLHPSTESFITDTDTDKMKRWRIEGGILPYQGIELSWYPKPSEVSDRNREAG